jgi:predicted lactoylglutathione lyase
MKINLSVDESLQPAANIFILGTYIREEIPNDRKIEIIIPQSIYIKLLKSEFNDYFSDVLIDGNFNESNIVIKIQETTNFEIIVGTPK